jgi:hypothetical protein
MMDDERYQKDNISLGGGEIVLLGFIRVYYKQKTEGGRETD